MKRVLLTLAALAAIGLATGSAMAERYGWSGGSHYGPNSFRPYNSRYSSGSYGGGSMHAAAVKRIMAAHSRYRYNPHPRSFYKSSPHPYDYWGW